jgi:hypothetical protein
MTKEKPARSLYRSLTVQSGIALSVLILARVLLPHIGYEVPPELFESLLALLLGTGVIGLRRALPVLILCLLPLGYTQAGCGATICKRATITIENHPDKPSPAAKIIIDCDGKVAATLHAGELKK